MTIRSYGRKSIQAEPIAHERDELEARYGHVCDTRQLARDFILLGIQPARLFVRRKNDGMTGWLAYQHAPRFYFHFQPDEAKQRTP